MAGQRQTDNAFSATTTPGSFVAVPEPSAFLFGSLICCVLGAKFSSKTLSAVAFAERSFANLADFERNTLRRRMFVLPNQMLSRGLPCPILAWITLYSDRSAG